MIWNLASFSFSLSLSLSLSLPFLFFNAVFFILFKRSFVCVEFECTNICIINTSTQTQQQQKIKRKRKEKTARQTPSLKNKKKKQQQQNKTLWTRNGSDSRDTSTTRVRHSVSEMKHSHKNTVGKNTTDHSNKKVKKGKGNRYRSKCNKASKWHSVKRQTEKAKQKIRNSARK